MSLNVESHVEAYLAALAGESGAPDAAETHLELWLAYMLSKLGTDSDAPGVVGLTKYVTLWENASPASSFVAQVINIDLSDYDYAIISIKYSTGNDITSMGMVTNNNVEHSINLMTAGRVMYRNFKINSDNKIEVLDAYTNTWANITNAFNTDTSLAIPLKIVGVKVVS